MLSNEFTPREIAGIPALALRLPHSSSTAQNKPMRHDGSYPNSYKRHGEVSKRRMLIGILCPRRVSAQGVRMLLLVGLLLAPVVAAQTASEQWAERYRSSPMKNQIPAEDRIDINRATLEQLLRVQGMTRTWAVRIVHYRPYHSKQDLADRGVVPGDVYNRIKDRIIAHRQEP